MNGLLLLQRSLLGGRFRTPGPSIVSPTCRSRGLEYRSCTGSSGVKVGSRIVLNVLIRRPILLPIVNMNLGNWKEKKDPGTKEVGPQFNVGVIVNPIGITGKGTN